MKKLFSILAIIPLTLTAAYADSEQETVDRSTRIILDARQMRDTSIPRRVLRQSKGVAIMTVVKAGFIFSGKGGHGVVVARTDRGWSGPSFIGTGGAGWGLQAGAQATDFIFILNNNAAVRAFSKGGNVTLGADASVSAGPVGRDAQVGVTPRAAIYSYSRTKGLFAGVSLEGAVIATRKSANDRYYGRIVSARDILQGQIAPPPGAARVRAALGR